MATRKTVTNGDWGVSTTSGSGIKGAILNVARHHDASRFPDRQWRLQYGELDGTEYPTDEAASAAALERGYTKLYSRNSCSFVMSRRARRAGMTTTDYRYNSCRAHWEKRRATN